MPTHPAYGVIYRITCIVNGKLYHGQTVDPRERWRHHLRKDSHCVALRNAIQKHGRENFKFETVAEAYSKDALDALERQFIASSLAPQGYNIKEGGANGRLSEETRRKISAANRVAQNRPDVRARNSAGVRKAWAAASSYEKQRRGEAIRKALSRPESQELRSRIMQEIHARPGEKERRSLSLQQYWDSLSDDDRDRRVKAAKDACLTDEYREKMRSTYLEVSDRPGARDHMIAMQKAAITPERKAAMSARMKDVHARPGERDRRSASIAMAHNTPEGKRKLARRRHRGETLEAWQKRIGPPDLGGTG